jgi:hypothetical protein
VKISEKLLERLRQDGQALPPCAELRRTNRNHRTGIGTWSWFAWCPADSGDPEHTGHGDLHLGSHWSMRELLAADRLTYTTQDWGDICVDPAAEQPEG